MNRLGKRLLWCAWSQTIASVMIKSWSSNRKMPGKARAYTSSKKVQGSSRSGHIERMPGLPTGI